MISLFLLIIFGIFLYYNLSNITENLSVSKKCQDCNDNISSSTLHTLINKNSNDIDALKGQIDANNSKIDELVSSVLKNTKVIQDTKNKMNLVNLSIK